ncbi:MAG: DUF3305 domain-containing protein [Roseateles depolymerans]|uniref:DUF3305 domain-containing protein n=1 Tax=Roseateles depolymerans TaxID=76731 RepID=A0A2W5DMY8_9BURK|nr:MAG: DUF3305 domain-containing protein [Roseateles depolymerans]
MTDKRPGLRVAVLFEREFQPNRWEDWRHRVADVVIDEGQFGAALDSGPLTLRDDGRQAQFLHGALEVALYGDEGEGYYLNLTSGSPVWFVMWRTDENDPSRAWPEAVSLSYNEAGRWLDSQERVDNLPLPAAVRDWLQAYTDVHYRPEPKQRKRPASFQRLDRR